MQELSKLCVLEGDDNTMNICFPEELKLFLLELDSRRLMNHVCAISRWERLSGSEDEAHAFDYIEAVLRNHDSAKSCLSIKRYEIPAYISIPIDGKVVVGEKKLDARPSSMSSPTPSEGIHSNIIYIPGDLSGHGGDMQGCIVMTDGMPTPLKAVAIKDSGAVGGIFIDNSELIREGTISPVWGSPDDISFDMIPKIPILTLNLNDGRWLRRELSKGNPEVTIISHMDTGWKKIPLLVVEICGKLDEFVLFSGHVDSWYYGAMDNASANAVMIEIAKLFSSHSDFLERGLKVAFWSGHSHGRYAGSAWYADNFYNELASHCVCHVNIDSVGAVGATVLTEAHVMPELKGLAAMAIKEVSGQDFHGTRFARAGDQSFWGHGIPSIFMTLSEQEPNNLKGGVLSELIGGSPRTGGLGWWWHTPQDTVDKICPENLLRDAKIYTCCLAELLGSSLLPFDFRLTCEELLEGLAYWENISQGVVDLEPLRLQLKDLSSDLKVFYEKIEHLPSKKVNSILFKLSRVLVPANYVSGSIFGNDSALPQPLLPTLAILSNITSKSEEERKFALIRARRAINKLVYLLDVAIKILNDPVS